MSKSLVPISNLHQFGILKDTPGLALAPNAFSDSLNVRFDGGCINKITGEADLVDQATLDAFNGNVGVGDIVHVAWWANPNLSPNNGYFVIVGRQNNEDSLFAIDANTLQIHDLGWSVPAGGDWQHAMFQGGYAIVLNNGLVRPCYILDTTGNTDISLLEAYELPGWDSYHTREEAVNDVYDPQIHIPDFDLGRIIDFTQEEIIVSVYSSDGTKKFGNTHQSDGTIKQTTVSIDQATDSHLISIALAPGGVGENAFTEVLEDTDNVVIAIRSINITQVRAGVIRAWGDTLVAGNLIELNLPQVSTVVQGTDTITFSSDHQFTTGDKIFMTVPHKASYTVTVVDSTDITVSPSLPVDDYALTKYAIHSSTSVVRNQPGVIRISDVAAPGSIPNNWNPYGVGVSTADEFQLSSTGIIQEVAEMQGRLFIYTNNSIHSITKTSSSLAPYVSDTVTSSYGALSRDCVKEFNGVHIVVGSNDVYKFGGHPASIESLGVDRIQDYLFDSLDADYAHLTQVLMHRAENEIWVCYCTNGNSSINEILMWNYKNNTWSIRKITNGNFLTIGPTRTPDPATKVLSAEVNPSIQRPIICTNNQIFGVDFKDIYTDRSNANYESYVERTDLAMTPEFDIEYLASIAMWVDKDVEDDIDLQFRFRSTDHPGQSYESLVNGSVSSSLNPIFTVGQDYKTDCRVNGRFLHWRLTDKAEASDVWKVIQLQLSIGKGGRR